MGKVGIVPGNAVPQEAILKFARNRYGAHAHQARPSYLPWAYTANPHCTQGLAQLLVAQDEQGRVIGFVNRFFMAWNVNGNIEHIPALTDLAVDEHHRAGGLGLRLIMAATKDVPHAFVNGSNANSSPLFRGLKYQEITGARWMRKILAPVRGTIRFLLHRLTGRLPDASLFFTAGDSGPSITRIIAPDGSLLEELATWLNADPAPVKLHWTAASLRWRFFDTSGPRHVLFLKRANHRLDGALICSAGAQRGLNVCRLVMHRASNPAVYQELLAAALGHARRNGVDAFMAFTFDVAEAKVLEAAGLRAQAAPATFFHHARKSTPFDGTTASIHGAASDIGFTSIPVSA
ncbi:MAG TPA: hypothetical protein VGE21_09640 [Flavobacteriales bacterium]